MSQILKISVVAIRESFLMILPYTIISSSILLLSQFLQLFNYDLSYVSYVFTSFFPFVIFVSVAQHFSIRHNVDTFMTFVVSFSLLITLVSSNSSQNDKDIIHNLHNLLIIFIPITTVLLLKYYKPVSMTSVYLRDSISKLPSYLLVSFKIYIISIVFYLFIEYIFSFFKDGIALDLSNESFLILRTFIVQLFWFIGLHGGNMFDIIIGSNFLSREFFENMNFSTFLNLFVLSGGSGAVLSLVIAILIGVKDNHSRKIAKMSVPFSLFNISEIMVFGLPIILNRHLLIPFVLIPLFNIIFALTVLTFYPIEIVNSDFSWSTPIFINAYYASNGDMYPILLQGIILIINILMYLPFVRRYANSQETQTHIEILQENLSIEHQFKEKEGITSYKAQEDIISSNIKLASIVKLLKENTMQLYLQPIVDIKKGKVSYFEGLLRLQMSDGSVKGPYFLEDLEKTGYSSIIDLWVCKEIKKHIDTLGNNDIQFNINIHPDTLDDTGAIDKIIHILKGKNIAFEVIERNLLSNTVGIKNINRLKQNGFKIYIDDVGDGYSNYIMFCNLPIDSIKIDKSLADIINTEKGYLVVKHIVSLAKSLGYSCVIEGIENKYQLELSMRLGIDFVQGYYYTPALKMQDAHAFKVKNYN